MGERRQNWTCGAHHELVESLRDINGKLDGMIVRQIAYAETSARIEAQSVLMNNDYQAAKAELEKLLKEKEGAK